MNIIVKSFTEDAEGNVVAEVFLDNAAKIKLLEGALNNAMLDGVTGNIPVQDECGLFGDDIADDIEEEEEDFYGQLGYFPETETTTTVITVVQEQIDALVIDELKGWYEDALTNWNSRHPEDIVQSNAVKAACETLLKYAMYDYDFTTYMNSLKK